MVLLTTIGEEQFGPWIPALLNATAISLVAILTSHTMLKRSLISVSPQGGGKGEFLQLKIGGIVFIFEAIVMLVLYVSPLTLTGWQEGLFDVVALTLGSSLVIYGIVLKPASEQELDSLEKGFRFDSTIATNILGYVCLMTLLLLALIATYEQQLQQRSVEIGQQEAKEIELIKEAFLNQLDHAARDLLIMVAQNDLQEFVNGDARDPYELQQSFRNIAAVKDYYDQLRLLDIEGKELIRIQRDDDLIRTTPQDQLQNKGERYYFQEAMRLSPGEVHISPLDLNIEGGELERPFNPMIRLTTPIVDRQGNKAGAIVINLRGNHLLKELEDATETTAGQLMLINEEGYWLFGDVPGELWAFMFQEESEQRFQHWYPEAWEKIEQLGHGTVLGARETFIVETVEFSDRVLVDYIDQDVREGHIRHWPSWKLVSYIPASLISGRIRPIRNLMILLYVAVLALVSASTSMLTRAMLKSRQAEIEVRQLAFYDPLTGLSNRRLFSEKLELEMAHARRQGTPLALMYMDLDYFKLINDELGHDAGDAALRESADRLKECLRACDTLARLGGDEFAVLLPRPGSNDDIAKVAQRIIEKFSEAFHPLGHARHLGISIGIGVLSEAEETPSQLTQRADHAMYEAKHSGRNCYRFAKA